MIDARSEWDRVRSRIRARIMPADSISALAKRAQVAPSALLKFMKGASYTLRDSTVEIDGRTADVLQAHAALFRLTTDEVLARVLNAGAARLLEETPALAEVTQSIDHAREPNDDPGED